MEVVRIVTVEGTVSQEVYNIVEEDPRSKLYTISGNGTSFKIHDSRILNKDSLGKAVVIISGGEAKGICPNCKDLLNIINSDFVECAKCGKFDIVVKGELPACTKPKRKAKTKPKRKLPKEEDKTMADSKPVNATIDLEDIKGSGGELWVKDKISFDHANIDVKTFALLIDGPARKLSFNTYNGSLGKRAKDLASLKLDEFREDKPDANGKTVGYRLKHSLDDERARLQKGGYQKV